MLDRAWTRRPLVSPAPFGRSIPGIWAETEITITRHNPVPNALGGFDGSADVPVATVWAHVEVQTESGLHLDSVGGPILRRYWTVIAALEHDGVDQWLGERPRRGDRMTWVDPLGQTITQTIKTADLPEGVADHWEIESERFE